MTCLSLWLLVEPQHKPQHGLMAFDLQQGDPHLTCETGPRFFPRTEAEHSHAHQQLAPCWGFPELSHLALLPTKERLREGSLLSVVSPALQTLTSDPAPCSSPSQSLKCPQAGPRGEEGARPPTLGLFPSVFHLPPLVLQTACSSNGLQWTFFN